jgi:hypothetical protein
MLLMAQYPVQEYLNIHYIDSLANYLEVTIMLLNFA